MTKQALTSTKKASIKVVKTGVNFGALARVRAGNKIVHETQVRPSGATEMAYADALSWMSKHGYEAR
jgi:hypothetical protein